MQRYHSGKRRRKQLVVVGHSLEVSYGSMVQPTVDYKDESGEGQLASTYKLNILMAHTVLLITLCTSTHALLPFNRINEM